MIEHLKDIYKSYYSVHSLGMNPGAVINFGMNTYAGNCLLSIHGTRTHKESSVKETLVESGIYTKENYINIGKTIEITHPLRRERKISFFDTAPLSCIYSTY